MTRIFFLKFPELNWILRPGCGTGVALTAIEKPEKLLGFSKSVFSDVRVRRSLILPCAKERTPGKAGILSIAPEVQSPPKGWKCQQRSQGEYREKKENKPTKGKYVIEFAAPGTA